MDVLLALERLLRSQGDFQTAERDILAFRTTVDGLVAEVDEVARLVRSLEVSFTFPFDLFADARVFPFVFSSDGK